MRVIFIIFMANKTDGQSKSANNMKFDFPGRDIHGNYTTAFNQMVTLRITVKSPQLFPRDNIRTWQGVRGDLM